MDSIGASTAANAKMMSGDERFDSVKPARAYGASEALRRHRGVQLTRISTPRSRESLNTAP